MFACLCVCLLGGAPVGRWLFGFILSFYGLVSLMCCWFVGVLVNFYVCLLVCLFAGVLFLLVLRNTRTNSVHEAKVRKKSQCTRLIFGCDGGRGAIQTSCDWRFLCLLICLCVFSFVC